MTVLKARKKPVEIETVQYDGENHMEIITWVGEPSNVGATIDKNENFLEINTLEGTMKASKGDYIIKGVQGEFYPCKPDIFEATYEILPAKTTGFG